jgi:putative effector of murein hydrolase LrgA (UPF0299 family)
VAFGVSTLALRIISPGRVGLTVTPDATKDMGLLVVPSKVDIMKVPDSFIELGFFTLAMVTVINLVASGVRATLLNGLLRVIVLYFTREN